jgi:hypothetical protein
MSHNSIVFVIISNIFAKQGLLYRQERFERLDVWKNVNFDETEEGWEPKKFLIIEP